MSASELEQYSCRPENCLATFRVRDKFGDLGLVGLGSICFDSTDRTASIDDFVLSCRAMGRGVEESMLSTLATLAARAGAVELHARYDATARNGPCLRFFEESGMKREANVPGLFKLDLGQAPVIADGITLVGLERTAHEFDPASF